MSKKTKISIVELLNLSKGEEALKSRTIWFHSNEGTKVVKYHYRSKKLQGYGLYNLNLLTRDIKDTFLREKNVWFYSLEIR